MSEFSQTGALKTGLRDLVQWRDEVTLVPFSGIQMLDFGFSLDDLVDSDVRRRFLEQETGSTAAAAEPGLVERTLIPLPRDPALAAEIEATRGPRDLEPYSIDKEKALAPFLDRWVPVPVLRVRKEGGLHGRRRYDPGPTSWARMRVTRLEHPDPATGHDHRVQLALDTMLAPENSAQRYVAPDRSDAENPREFGFVSDPDLMGWFLTNPKPVEADPSRLQDFQKWASDWIRDLFIEMKQAEAEANGRVFRKEQMKYDFEHWARYLQYLFVVDHAVRIPRFRFLDTVSTRDAVAPVEVDLVLDIGNSRTCGILVERFPDEAQVELTKSYPLEMRDLSRPELFHSGLFESRVEFAELNFGNDRFAAASGRGNGFLWPSFVRVGPEARRLTQSESGTETTSGLSSPKRYLWDSAPVKQDWRFHGHTDPNNLPRNARAVMQYLNEAGDDLAEIAREMDQNLRPRDADALTPAIRPRFSRSSVYSFMLAEIIAHVLVQINDPAGRSRRAQTDLPRRLSRIILTLPTATPVQEQKIIRSRANAALALVWKRLGISGTASNIAIAPELIVDWDEASCTQLVYLYSEITQRMAGQIDDYLGLKGRERPHPRTKQSQPSVRLACIDVGGGTTDLMVTTYFSESNSVLEPVQTFREGFRIAGDDLVRRIIAELLLPAIAVSAEQQGGRNIQGKLRELFGGDVGGQDQQSIQKRRQFVLRVLRPIATAVITAAESEDRTKLISLTAVDVLGLGPQPDHADQAAPLAVPANVLAYLEQAMAAQGARGWSLRDFQLSLDRGTVDGVLREVFHTAIGNMVEVIDHLGADVVLLTGRPSRLPALRALVEEALVCPPDRIVSMHRYRTDRWYPYRDAVTQRIGDPKSTVAVGGMLIALAGNQIPNFKVRTEAYRMRSTAAFIGLMDNNGQIRTDRVLFAPPDRKKARRAETRAEVQLYHPLQIGFRQLRLDRWTTTPLYRLDFANDGARGRKPPLKVVLERPEIDDSDDNPSIDRIVHNEALLESLTPTEVYDGEGEDMQSSEVTLRLQTMGIAVDYWLDTGIVGE